jgi:hypothetical protein
MDATKLIRLQAEGSISILESMLADSDTLICHNKNYLCLERLSSCLKVISGRKESAVFSLALKEYQFAMFALCLGLYRQSFSALRLTLELCLATIEFSGNEVLLRCWLKGQGDINWSRLMNVENGVLSTTFVNIFFEDLGSHAPSFRAIAEKVYREFSEFVHGNAHTHQMLPKDLEFSKPAVIAWSQKAESICLVVMFAFICRYFEDIDPESREEIAPVLLETLGHLEPLRMRLGGPDGG